MAATSDPTTSTRLGEVIETNTTGFVGESDQLHILPELGALVRVGSLDDRQSYYGVVSFGATGGLDTGRRAVRRGGDGLSDAAIYERHPELELVLRTIFGVAVIGYRDGASYRHTLPARPVPLHYSVYPCNRREVENFCREPRYLPALLSYRGEISPEQLVASHLAWVDATLDDGHDWLADTTRRLARLMKRDYDRFVTIIEAIAPA